jgi:hypothetical protein
LGVSKPELSGGFVALEGNEIEPGLLRVGGYRMTGDQNKNSGRLVEFVFAVKITGGEVTLRTLTDDLAHSLVAEGNLRID